MILIQPGYIIVYKSYTDILGWHFQIKNLSGPVHELLGVIVLIT